MGASPMRLGQSIMGESGMAAASDNATLREVKDEDLPIFFEQQRDAAANHMAAFTVKDPADHDAFQARWKRLRADAGITIRTVLFAGRAVGHVALFGPAGEREVTYWLGREYWGKGIVTAALSQFLRDVPDRPLYARAAKDNLASLRVLAKCGFTVFGHDRFYANARQEEIEEVTLKLEGTGCGKL
jgi:RimJ/RimL family protein N-acetyltransferase